MNARTWAAAVLVLSAGLALPATPARAQDAEQWKKMYEGVIEQLKAAQERKNQLATENEKLVQQLDAVKKELAAAKARVEELSRTDADHAEKTFFLRSHYMAWQQFVGHDLDLQARWRRYLESEYLAAPRKLSELTDREWPFTVTPRSPEAPATQPGTQPATQPGTTQPATTQATTTPATPATATAPTTTPSVAPAATAPATTTSPSSSPATTRPG